MAGGEAGVALGGGSSGIRPSREPEGGGLLPLSALRFSSTEDCIVLALHTRTHAHQPPLLGTELSPGWRRLQSTHSQNQEPAPGSGCLSTRDPQAIPGPPGLGQPYRH